MGNDLVASRKTFGFHGRKDEGREGNLRTRGGLLYYGYDGLGSVTDLSDRTGDEVMQYRYDAFGGLFTGITSPYNTVGFTGKSYDPKASLVEFYARWYDPSVGRFTTQDSYLGNLMDPASQHRYAYVLNNPATHVDRWGYVQEGDPGGGSTETWGGPYIKTTYESNSWTETSTWDETRGDYLFIHTVVTRYTERYAVVTHYMKSNYGSIDVLWVDRNLLGTSSEIVSSSVQQVWLGNDDGDGAGNGAGGGGTGDGTGDKGTGGGTGGGGTGGGGNDGGQHEPTKEEKRADLFLKTGEALGDAGSSLATIGPWIVRGRGFHKLIYDVTGEVENWELIHTEAGNFRPDVMKLVDGVLTDLREIKHVARLYATRQLTAMLQYAEDMGIGAKVIISEQTKVSQPLLRLAQRTGATIERYSSATGELIEVLVGEVKGAVEVVPVIVPSNALPRFVKDSNGNTIMILPGDESAA